MKIMVRWKEGSLLWWHLCPMTLQMPSIGSFPRNQDFGPGHFLSQWTTSLIWRSSSTSCLHISPSMTCSFMFITRTTLSPFSCHLCRTARRSSRNITFGSVLRPFSWINLSCCLYTVTTSTLVFMQGTYAGMKYVLCPVPPSTWYHENLPSPMWSTLESFTNAARCSLMIVAVPPL